MPKATTGGNKKVSMPYQEKSAKAPGGSTKAPKFKVGSKVHMPFTSLPQPSVEPSAARLPKDRSRTSGGGGGRGMKNSY